MKRVAEEHHKFDEVIRLVAVILLISFCVVLILFNSDMAQDVVLLVVGMISGRYLKG